jgi:peptide/nickel transport system permease protein
MLAYVVRRLLWLPVVLFVVSFATFVLARLGPGDPIRIAAGQFRDPEAFERVKKARGLDKPITEQYWLYVRSFVQGDFGESYRFRGRKVEEVIFPRLWHSLQYNTIALGITLSLGIPLGIFAARRQGTWADPASIGSFLFLQSIPSLVSIPFLLLFLSLKLDLVPARGWPQENCFRLDFLPEEYACIGVLSREALIPILALAIPSVAFWARYTRATVLNVLGEDYVRTARAKGIDEYSVMTRHVMRNALLPLSTLVAFALVGLLEGSFFVETLMGVPGIGQLAFESVQSRDYDLILAITLLGAGSFVLATIVIDIAYTWIDPRIRYDTGSR